MKKKQVLPMLLAMLAGAILSFGSIRLIEYSFPIAVLKNMFRSSTGWEDAVKLAGVLVAMWAALLVHELGHLVTGLALKFRFHIVVVGPLGIRRNPDTDRVEGYLNRDARLYGGIAGPVPLEKGPHLRSKFAAIVAAGPIVSLFMGVVALWLGYMNAYTLTINSLAMSRIAVCFCLTFGAFSCMLFLATTVPFRTGPFFTDRARFFRLMGGGHAAAIEQATLELLVHSQSGQSYANSNPEQIDLLLNEPESSLRLFAHIMAYYRHLDRQEMMDAFERLKLAETLLEGQPEMTKIEIWKELAFAYAYIEWDVKEALANWGKIKPSPESFPSAFVYLFWASLSRAQGEPVEQINAWVTKGLAALPATLTRSEDRLRHKLLTSLTKLSVHSVP
ncbi:M50 family metallopeptidase [Spirosoma sp. KCTC 42546]|uniref:M50 family metallopeptidase n=1 Tax=Spirosoma sp. KCTC 42546 TaxID=2520506 RepID=UPI00115717B2|nr:M50 family metallopeptidase [Spirosoma sp. KCTC 42546]QDK79507.1 M50 family metallopeptidase [Spirosoma sp. KCTC 42546]